MNSAVKLETRPAGWAPKVVRPSPPNRAELLLFVLVLALLVFAPLAYGSVEEWSVLALEIGASVLLLVWAALQVMAGEIRVHTSAVLFPMACLALVPAIQLVLHLSAYTHQTVGSLLRGTAYLIIACVAVQALRRTSHRFLTFVTAFGAAYAFFAIVQSFTAPGRLYWFRQPRFGGWVFGSYVNHNNYAGLLELLLPFSLVMSLARYTRPPVRIFAGFAAALMGTSVLLSGSRGGIIAVAAQLAVFSALAFREKGKWVPVAGMGALCALILAGFLWVGDSEAFGRLGTMRYLASSKTVGLIASDRLAMSKDGIRMFAAKPVVGWGLGTFGTVYPQFRSFYTDRLVDYAHNDYVQLLAEAGMVGWALAVWFVVKLFQHARRRIAGWRGSTERSVALAGLTACAGLLVHSFTDFNLQIPANALWFFVIAAVATSPMEETKLLA